MAEAPQQVAAKTGVHSFTEETLPPVLKNALLGSLVTGEDHPLIVVHSDTKLTDALKLFREHKILSAPVLDVKEKLFLGTLDLFDIMSFIAFIPYFEREERKKQYFEIKGELLDNTTVSELHFMHRVKRRQLYCFDKDSSLARSLHHFAEGVHRGIIATNCGFEIKDRYRILSQFDVLSFVHEHAEEVGDLLQHTLEDLGMASRAEGINVLHCSASDDALHGFGIIYSNNVNGIAVVDEKDAIVANLSTYDLSSIDGSSLEQLCSNVIKFLDSQYEGKGHPQPVTVVSTDTLAATISKMVNASVHRVWVVDSANRPTAVVTMSDILRAIAPKKEE
mmetsp:Transcript_37543/g.94394  ORF Transcript_37543/g.94394 Transcript_37543/m.94394 type:complete len:335 (-) Transcript_37543:63-1067(-)|eukprot:CAMPEP_0177649916 /NCGR_PEP_ID=MMETSP0447-20121125/11651_1 /TAXON_ID=0 /ORGANISM="Stygamoeba regulata, Strain BSH-02190019" /LENGTH=334 /DNA_ID=CAMNT_0019152725 /DNA_START=110 /DNA_END=1114 /DNA_ORIENTATION=+